MYYNPLVKFRPEMLPGFADKKVRYLVAQQYYRGKLPNSEKLPLLLTDYQDLAQASRHLQNITATDKWAAIIDLQNPKHISKLSEMCLPYSEYTLYAAFTDTATATGLQNNQRLKNAAKTYIDSQTNWRPGSSATVQAILELQYGELFVTFKLGQQRKQERLTTLETTRSSPTGYPMLPAYDGYRIHFQGAAVVRR